MLDGLIASPVSILCIYVESNLGKCFVFKQVYAFIGVCHFKELSNSTKSYFHSEP